MRKQSGSPNGQPEIRVGRDGKPQDAEAEGRDWFVFTAVTDFATSAKTYSAPNLLPPISNMTQKLTINEELKNLLPPLTVEELQGLEEGILRDGCLTPLLLWNGILIDGHHRHAICTKHNIPFLTQSVDIESLDDAKLWIFKHQENRRNLTTFHRAEIALKLKDTIAAKAKERQRAAGGNRKSDNAKSVVENSPQPVEAAKTRQELAEFSDVSDNTIARVEYISEHADEETKEKLRKGEKGTSINKEYKKLKDKEKQQAKSEKTAVAQEASDEFYPKTTLKLIPQESPHVLLANLFDHFRKGFVEPTMNSRG